MQSCAHTCAIMRTYKNPVATYDYAVLRYECNYGLCAIMHPYVRNHAHLQKIVAAYDYAVLRYQCNYGLCAIMRTYKNPIAAYDYVVLRYECNYGLCAIMRTYKKL